MKLPGIRRMAKSRRRRPLISKADVERRGPDSTPEHLRVARLRRQAVILVYPADPVDQALGGPQYRIKEGLLASANTSHEDPQRLGDEENRKEIQADG